jgi:hypothetical protein
LFYNTQSTQNIFTIYKTRKKMYLLILQRPRIKASGLLKVKVKTLCLTKHHPMKTYWGSDGIDPRSTSALDGGEWSVSPAGRFTRREIAPGTYWTG